MKMKIKWSSMHGTVNWNKVKKNETEIVHISCNKYEHDIQTYNKTNSY